LLSVHRLCKNEELINLLEVHKDLGTIKALLNYEALEAEAFLEKNQNLDYRGL